MSEIDFAKKMSFQRYFSRPKTADDAYTIVRQFESDRGRIINSAAIRRLQQKTQVFPLERNAAVRSRLTHSMEVQQVGRYIAKEILHRLHVEGRLASLGLLDKETPFESMVEMACLMHDIGNPPFGHFGESAINQWFRKLLDSHYLDGESPDRGDNCNVPTLRMQRDGLDELRGQIRQDLSHFEGNAQAIRLVHTLLKLNLTYGQVACILKYTRPAYWHGALPSGYDYLMKKPGYYLAEEAFVARLREELDMGEFHRHPLSYIMEAADDVSYCIADLEDAVEKDILTIEALYERLRENWGAGADKDIFARTIERAYKERERFQWRSRDDLFFMNLRVYTVGQMVPHAALRFIENLPEIYSGAFNQALLEDDSPQNRLLGIFKRVAVKHVFNHHEVEQLELQGDRVIRGLLDIYRPLLDMPYQDFSQLVRDDVHKQYPIETRLYHKLSSKHCLAYREAVSGLDALPETERIVREYYYRARLIQDYISGMTDLYAYDEYRKLMAAD
ncbi:dGTPase [Samsonia erythrinae]|uniref:Deoxyguanosinetriphosphate triphosphohydrolase n=1 Tax=Samsonia erythrinae TaxID=160434 RepID=A0A4R3VIQ1_9GAMM|nr:dGTPase [Samsonia erythrinae]TCV03649.1 dGTPase [Samsonia erythrinae]